jgi:Arc/MetJ-type ribon-helix-helix transcriptional regulator
MGEKPVSLRLDEASRRTVARLARERRCSQSEVIREGIAALADRSSPAPPIDV